VLAVPIGTVMSRISRGRKLLHRHLTDDAGPAVAHRTGTAGPS
jgi:DNA-directed RNA polymerase specialized sigma24 family protein